jgi:hypothetical protein
MQEKNNSFINQNFLYEEKKNGSFNNSDFSFETEIVRSAITIFHTIPSGSFVNQFLHKKQVVHLAIRALPTRNHCVAPTYQTACSAQDTAHKQYRTCDAVVHSEHHVVYHCLVDEESYFDEASN